MTTIYYLISENTIHTQFVFNENNILQTAQRLKRFVLMLTIEQKYNIRVINL